MKRKNLVAALIVLCAAAFTFTACYDMVEQIVGNVAVNGMKDAYIESHKILEDGQIHVIVSGSGTPRIMENRGHPCTAVIANGQFLIFDAGPGAVDNLSKQGYPIQDIEHVFLTHMHSDHMGGIAAMINLSYNIGRRNVIQVYGPDDSNSLTHSIYPPTSKEYREGHELTTPFGLPEIRAINELTSDDLRNGIVWDAGPEPDLVYIPGVVNMVEGINRSLEADSVIRTSHKLIPEVPQGWDYCRAEANVIGDMPNTGGEDKGWGEFLTVATFPDNGSGHGDLVVKAFLVDHYPCWPSYGFRIEYAGKIVVISGDTESLMPHDPEPGEVSYWATYAQNADVLVHDAVSMLIANIMLNAILADPDLMAVPSMDQRVAQLQGAADHHTDVLDAARAARDANAAKLVLTHIAIPMPVDFMKDLYVEGMDAIYTGEIILGTDALDIVIPLTP